jgi:hypothetical protein
MIASVDVRISPSRQPVEADTVALLEMALREVRVLGGPGSGNFGHVGRPGQVGGSATLDSPGIDQKKFDKVKRRSESIAAEMGINPSVINVVDKEPRAFTVGDQQFREAGHYNPQTGTIEINARNAYDDRMSVTNGIAAHEVSHAIYDAARGAQAEEHKEITDLPSDDYNRLFRKSGYVRPEMQPEVHERFPVSAMFYRHLGDPYMETEEDQQGGGRYRKMLDRLEHDDGVSDYSKSYWKGDVFQQSGGVERAVNETLAETMRHQISSMSWQGEKPHETWSTFAADLRKIVKLDKVRSRIRRRE